MSIQTLSHDSDPVNEVDFSASDADCLPPLGEEDDEAIDDFYLKRPPQFPVQVFAPEIQDVVWEAAEAFGTATAIPGVAMLIQTSAMIGRSRLVELKTSWHAAGNLWTCVVGKSGAGKSPCMKEFLRPIREIESIESKKFNDEMDAYEENEDDEDSEKRQPPRLRQVIVGDSTIEKTADILAQNPKGLLWTTDELGELIASFSRYKATGIKEKLLSAFDGEPWRIDRVNQKRTLYIPNACISLNGSIQPERFSKIFTRDDSDSGFLQRFLLCRIEREKVRNWNEKSFSEKSRRFLKEQVLLLHSWTIEYDQDGNEIPRIVSFTPDAKKEFIGFFDELAKQAFALDDGKYEKFQSYIPRLALNLHCQNAAIQHENGLSPITLDEMQAAITLIRFFLENQSQCWQLVSADNPISQPTPLERKVMQIIVENAQYILQSGGKIPNRILCEKIRTAFPEHVDITNDKFGRIFKKLNMKSCRIQKERGQEIPENLVSVFKTSVGSVKVL